MCNNILIILLFFLLVYNVFCYNSIEFNVAEGRDNALYCKENKQSVRFIEHQKIILTVYVKDKPKYINDIMCQPNIVHEIKDLRNKDPQIHANTLMLPNITTMDMSGIWNCTIRMNKNSGIKPIYVDKQTGYRYTQVKCSVQVEVMKAGPPVSVLVNRLQLYITQDQDSSYSAIYQYADGDSVDILCKNSVCSKTAIVYKPFISDDNLNKQWQSDYGAGIRMKLTHEHDGSIIYCNCVDSSHRGAHVKVKLNLRTYPNDTSFFKLNGYPVRDFSNFDSNPEKANITICYWNSRFEDIMIEYEKHSFEIIERGCYMTRNGDLYTIDADQDCDVVYKLTKESKFLELIIFKLPKAFYEGAKLSMDISKNVNYISMYKLKGKELILLQYKDGDQVNLTCSAHIREASKIKTHISFNNQEEMCKSDAVRIQKHMDSSYNNEVMTCILRNCKKNKVNWVEDLILYEIQIKFLQIVPEVSQNGYNDGYTSSESDSFYLMIIIAGCIVVCTVFVCVVTIIYKMKRKHLPRESNYENFENDNIPTHPPQWNQENHYHVPVDQKNDTVYAEPENNIEQPYATPLPKHLRPKKQNVIYASLEKKPARKSQNLNTCQAPYATIEEVFQQRKEQTSYDNVFGDSRYVNSNNTDYVEPTYCQPHVIK